jgi:glutamine synthetase
MSADDVLKTIHEKEVRFVDLRFTDTIGKEQHVTVPSSVVDADFFEEGKMFDGSSIAGWKGINESDMVLMPDLGTAVMDPFADEATLIVTCDVLEPATMEGYGRDPRSIAKRAEAFMKSSGVADTAYFGPEPEFFVFDSVRWDDNIAGAYYHIESEEASWSSGDASPDGNIGHRPGVKGGYFPVPPVDSLYDVRCAMVGAMEEMGLRVVMHLHPQAHLLHGRCDGGDGPEGGGASPRGGHRRSVRDRHCVRHPGPSRRPEPGAEVLRTQRGACLR